MNYISTRNKNSSVSSASAISKGISEEGGLFVPQSFPKISLDFIKNLSHKDYIGRANDILSLFLTDFTADELMNCVKNAYGNHKFADEAVAPVKKLSENAYMLELWHGPTCAFKDMALQLLPHLLTTSIKKTVNGKKVVILVATSGDTGKAALEGFKDVENTQILVFYPEHGVSNMQKLQMATQEGENVAVCAIEGNFDDAQSSVKKIFTDNAIKKDLEDHSMMFSSANSINWGRLVPQIVYYFSSYCDLLNKNEITLGDEINFVVPTGNFGNILAGYYAKKMGLPIHKLICASNKNNVLTDFINTGVYNRNRDFYATNSPSMDILISSNLERLLFDLYHCDDQAIAELMHSLSDKGEYCISSDVKEKLTALFFGGCCNEEQTSMTIKAQLDNNSYLCDTHTAVAVNVYEQYKEQTKDTTKTVIVSTASPYKFPESVLSSLSDADFSDEFEAAEKLSGITNTKAPSALAELKNKSIRFTNCCSKQDMKQIVYKMLGIEE